MANFIFVGTHYDDLELSCGGTISSLSKQKNNNLVAIITSSSDYTDYNGKIIRSKECAKKEGFKALRYLGINKIYPLNYPTKSVPYNSKLTEDINKILDQEEADFIIIPHVYDTHPDHANTAKASISAGRYYSNILMTEPFYPSNVSYRGAFKPQIYVNITKHIYRKLNALKMHESEYKSHKHWEDMVLTKCRERGIEVRTKYAECFEPVKFIWEIK